jgi:hypothetical protein
MTMIKPNKKKTAKMRTKAKNAAMTLGIHNWRRTKEGQGRRRGEDDEEE